MAYEAKAATSSQTAEMRSPRTSAITPQAIAPAMDTAPQISNCPGLRAVGGAPGLMVVVMVVPSSHPADGLVPADALHGQLSGTRLDHDDHPQTVQTISS